MFLEISLDTALYFDTDSILKTYYFLMIALNTLMVVFFEKELREIGLMKTLGFFAFSPVIVMYTGTLNHAKYN